MWESVKERLKNEPVAVRGAIAAVVTAVAIGFGVEVENPMVQTAIGVLTALVNGLLIKSARDKVTPV